MLTFTDVDLLEQLAIEEARESFWAYRRLLNPTMKLGWWQRTVARALQTFAEELLAGKAPYLVVEAPPQHGKSKMITELVTWVAGKNPDLQTIYTSFSDRLGVRANLLCQRIYDSPRFQKVFPETRITAQGALAVGHMAVRNRELIEYAGRDGYFRNTTVRGAITGESLDLGVIDDPIKGRDEARSQTNRDNVWDWLTDDFFTRFSDTAGLLCILTRWHVDDPIGRLKKKMGSAVKVISYPAIATQDERYRKAGEALFPEHKSLAFLEERRRLMARVNWEALYQQNPQIEGGEIIKGAWFSYYTVAPKLRYRAIYGDTAQKTAERNDYSVFECWGHGEDGKAYLLDLIRGKWESPDLKRNAILFWNKHKAQDPERYGALRKLKVEDKVSGTGLIQDIRKEGKIPVEGIERTKDKYTRVLDGVGYIESGYVCVPLEAPWVSEFVAECEDFTANDSHQYDDQVDPMMDAIKDMLAQEASIYDNL